MGFGIRPRPKFWVWDLKFQILGSGTPGGVPKLKPSPTSPKTPKFWGFGTSGVNPPPPLPGAPPLKPQSPVPDPKVLGSQTPKSNKIWGLGPKISILGSGDPSGVPKEPNPLPHLPQKPRNLGFWDPSRVKPPEVPNPPSGVPHPPSSLKAGPRPPKFGVWGQSRPPKFWGLGLKIKFWGQGTPQGSQKTKSPPPLPQSPNFLGFWDPPGVSAHPPEVQIYPEGPTHPSKPQRPVPRPSFGVKTSEPPKILGSGDPNLKFWGPGPSGSFWTKSPLQSPKASI